MKSNSILTFIVVFLISLCSEVYAQKSGIDLKYLYQKASGKPETMVLACYKTTMLANGSDETMLRVSVADSTGMELLDAGFTFRISVAGDASVLMTDRSVPELVSETDTLRVWQSKLENGLKEFILKAGKTPGKMKVEVTAEKVWAASHEVHTIPGDVKLLKPTAQQIKPSANIPLKMIGADISFLPQLEAEGMKFSDQGVEKDAIEILKSHGINYIRLRIFVNPENEKGYSPQKGYCGLEGTLAMASRIKEAGLNLLLDFHYSDYWADPQQQFKPKAWEGLPYDELVATLKEYTKATLLSLKAQGTPPQMVQIGNEINHGIVWPEGHISNLDNLAGLLKAGTEACREVDPLMPVMMHVALGGQNEEAVFWYDNMIARGVEFDIIGLSYYPRWHGTLDDLNYNLSDLAKRYQKDVNVVEYSAFKREIHEVLFNVADGRGNGTCIWEPLNTWSRIFDKKGNATNDILIYDEIRGKYLN